MKPSILQQRNDYTGIDIFKFLMAFAVIAIHCRLDNIMGDRDWPHPIGFIIGMAVPFFFITSGFLIAQKIDNPKITDIKKRLLIRKRSYTIFRIFLYWLIIYLPIAIYSYISDGTVVCKAIAGYIYKVATGGHSIWAWQLWFIYSMAWVTLIYSITLLSTRTTTLLMLSFTVISLVNIGFQTYGLSMFKWSYITITKTRLSKERFTGLLPKPCNALPTE